METSTATYRHSPREDVICGTEQPGNKWRLVTVAVGGSLTQQLISDSMTCIRFCLTMFATHDIILNVVLCAAAVIAVAWRGVLITVYSVVK